MRVVNRRDEVEGALAEVVLSRHDGLESPGRWSRSDLTGGWWRRRGESLAASLHRSRPWH